VGGTIFGVIPARYASERFPGKPLALIAGIPMVVRVYRRALASGIFDALVVATDDQRIRGLCQEYALPVLMTRADHRSGSDRVHEAALSEIGRDAEIIVNVQGDEPLLDPASLEALVRPLRALGGESLAAASLYARITAPEEYADPNVVKVVLGADGKALYFSRAPIPFMRGGGLPERAYRHIGLYAYTRAALGRFAHLPAGFLEKAESLEQLRLLENGIPLYMEEAAAPSPAVDTPADLARVEAVLWEERRGSRHG